MPINVFGNSIINNNKIDNSLFVQKPYLRTNYIEANIEEDIDLKIEFRLKNLPDPISIREAAAKNYVDDSFNDSSIIKNTAHIDLNDRNITNASFFQVNELPQIDSHLAAKQYVDNAIDEPSLVRNTQNNNFNNYNLTNINSITLNKQAENDNEVITKAYVGQFHQEKERSRQDAGLDFYDESKYVVKSDQTKDFNDKIILNVTSIQINNNRGIDDHAINKKCLNDELDSNTLVRLNDESIDRYLKVPVNNYPYNLQIYNKTQIIDTTKMIFPNTGNDLLQNWKILCNNRYAEGKPSEFIKSTKTSSLTASSGATNLPPIGTAFMYIETSANNHNSSNDVFVSFERTDIIHISNITFYHNRFSTSDSHKRGMGKFEIQILRNGSWQTDFTIEKDTNFYTSSIELILLNMNIISQPNYGIKLLYSSNNGAHADMCFSDINITHSIF